MCGRYAITLPAKAARDYFGYVDEPEFPPRYNIAPTQPVPIVRLERRADVFSRRFQLVRWGFVPSFVKDPRAFPLLFNARAESAPDKPSFRAAMKRRRCLFIADAYYEWRREPGRGRPRAGAPFLFRRADGAPLALAGLYETLSSADGSEVDTACILTTSANGATVAIHERMPAVIERQDFDLWLNCGDERGAEDAWRLLAPATCDTLEFFEIGPDVNKAENDGPWIQAPHRSRLL
ncbi:SOS response-associated peptidase [Methylosinus sp. Sm6]|uniref:SOS response-associated peptidase n=1 Tax=Methylosinus sp. Sm6 TaxID=2866948 RepID=UPI001C9A1625|nr:SOS response-associated peptidase [Methylosinus sp. Sm6]MBY6241596.1 SOS response-associated peptidase [Methylosinus sp. Sm6]